MMENPEVALVFEEVADLLELQGQNPFRIRAYRTAARTIRDLGEALAGMTDEQIGHLPGIGKDLAEKIRTLLETGELPLLRQVRSQVPAGLKELLGIADLGPKRAALLHAELRITCLDELRAAAQEQRIRALKGFGPKMEQKILASLEARVPIGRRVTLAEAKVFADALLARLRGAPGVGSVEVAGSFRRRRETVGDLDVLACGRDPEPIMDLLATYGATAEVLGRGPTKMSVRLRNGLQADLRVVPEESYGAALQYFTGSKEHSIQLRRRAQQLGLKISEYGVFRGDERIAGSDERDVYAAVGVPWIPPELREAHGEIELALEQRLPALLTLDDIRGDLHMHSTSTDGRASIPEMVTAARRRGLAYVAITDHSKRVSMAGGLDGPALREQWRAIDRLAEAIPEVAILKGVELDILEDGSLDLPDEVLAGADFVVASIHYGQRQPRDQITRRLLGAIRSPYVHAIGHLTARLIGKRPGVDADLETVFRAAAEHGCLLEVNAQPDRLDLDDVAVRAARQLGARFVINTDAHSTEELAFMEFGVWQARRGGLEARDVANTRVLPELRALLKPPLRMGR
jgi:DNA polymerase (family X)